MKKKTRGYWTYEKCLEIALKCDSRTEFHNYYMPYRTASKNKWLEEICSHMKPINRKLRCIYSYEFSDNSVYIGLTWNLQDRNNRHYYNKDSSVYIHSKLLNEKPKIKQLSEFLSIEKAKEKENFYVNDYKKNNWIILNKASTGSIGSNIVKWTKEKCQEVALKCKTKTELYKKYGYVANLSLKNKWLDDICSHMIEVYKPRGYWNDYNVCLNEAKNQKTMTNFRIKSSGAFNSCVKNGWKEKIYKDMNWIANKRQI